MSREEKTSGPFLLIALRLNDHQSTAVIWKMNELREKTITYVKIFISRLLSVTLSPLKMKFYPE